MYIYIYIYIYYTYISIYYMKLNIQTPIFNHTCKDIWMDTYKHIRRKTEERKADRQRLTKSLGVLDHTVGSGLYGLTSLKDKIG